MTCWGEMTIALVITSLVAAIAVFYAIKFAMLILKVERAIEESLDLLDNSYKELLDIAGRPLFMDSREVRACLNSIKDAGNAVLAVAITMSASVDRPQPEENEESDA